MPEGLTNDPDLIVGPPNTGRAGEIRAASPRRSTATRCSSCRRATTSTASSASSAARRRRWSAARSAPSGALRGRRARRPDRRAAPRADADRSALARPRARSRGRAARAARARRASPGFAPAIERADRGAAVRGGWIRGRSSGAPPSGRRREYERELGGALPRLRRAARRRRPRRHARRGAAAIAALRARPDAWGGRPVLLYGFDDLTAEQLELVAALAAAADGHRRRHLRGPRGARRPRGALSRAARELGGQRRRAARPTPPTRRAACSSISSATVRARARHGRARRRPAC